MLQKYPVVIGFQYSQNNQFDSNFNPNPECGALILGGLSSRLLCAVFEIH